LRSEPGLLVRGAAFAAVAAAFLFAHAAPGRADTIPVSSTADLQAAVIDATNGDTIVMAAGNYAPSAPLTITHSNLTIVGPQSGFPGVVITGTNDTAGTQDLFDVGVGASLTLRNVSLRTVSTGATAAIVVDGSLDLENSDAQGNNNVVVRSNIGASVVVRNSTIALNTFSSTAAAVDVQGDVKLFDDTIVGNDYGIAMDGGTAELVNTIVSGNALGDCPSGGVTSSVRSLDTDGSCGVQITANPKLGNLQANGGSTQSEALLPGSPAIDAGSNAPGDCPLVDQRYAPRSDGRCDIGAYEAPSADTVPPVVTVPADLTSEATSAAGAAVTFAAGALDAHDGPVATACAPSSGATFPLGTTTVTCTAQDAAGNTGSASFHVTVVDTTPPAIAAASDVTVVATGPSGAAVAYTPPAATDLVDGAVPVACAPGSGTTFAIGTTTVTCSATDAHGNTGSGSFHVTVLSTPDTTPPAIVVPAPIAVEATGPGGAAVAYTASATDNVAVASFGCVPASGATFPLGTTTVTCTATDTSGNAATATFAVTVRDTTAPALAVPAALTVEATGPDGAAVAYSAIATDAVGVASFACAPASGSTFPLGTTTVACSAADAAGNTAATSFRVTVRDTTAPAFTDVPADVTVEETSATGTAVDYVPPTATDAVDGAVPVACSPPPGSTFAPGETTVTCTAVDAHGNAGSATFVVTVGEGAAPPVVHAPTAVTAEATGPDGAAVAFTVSAVSAPGTNVIELGCEPGSGSTFPLGETTVTCTAVDSAGASSSASFDVTVVDTSPPTLSGVPADIAASTFVPAGARITYAAPTAVDLVDGPVPVSCTPPSGSSFVRVTTVVCTAADAHGNTAAASFTVSVALLVDVAPPLISVPPSVSAEAQGPAGAVVDFDVSADDVHDGAVPVACTPGSGSVFAIGSTTVSCTAHDAAGNAAARSFAASVIDTTAPQVTVPADLVVEATGPTGAAVPFSISATDAVGVTAAGCSPAAGSVFPLGRTTVECNAFDAAGNHGSGTFAITVTDTTAPTLGALPAAPRAVATTPAGAVVRFATPTASDLADGPVPATCSPASGSVFPIGTSTVGCTAVDAHGNRVVESFEVTVVPPASPFLLPPLSVPARIVAQATSRRGAVVRFAAKGGGASACAPHSGSRFPLGATTVRCSSRNDVGRTHRSFVVRVVDTTPPVFAHVPRGVEVVRRAYVLPTARDAVDGRVAVRCTFPPASLLRAGRTGRVACAATDAHRNRATVSFEVRLAPAPAAKGGRK
jgi:hypothetical protein